MTSSHLRSPVCLAIGLAMLAAGAAHAQNAERAQSEDDSLLEEVVITADRADSFGADLVQAGTFRGAKLLDTPLTVNVLPRELLDAQQATQLHDVLRNTAGVTSAQLNNAVYSNMAIRGITVENRGNYRLNGSLPVVNLIDLPMENKERVEVLKGVSALYYGFTTPSGIINLTSKRSPAQPLLDVTAYGNSHGSIGAHVDWGSRFYDGKFGVRLNGLYGRHDIGVSETDGFRSFGSVALDFRPTEALSFELDVEHIRKKMSEPVTYSVAGPMGTILPLPPIPEPETNLGGRWQYGDGYEDNVLLAARYRFARDWELSAQAGRSYLDRDRFFSQFQNYNLTTGIGQVAVTLTNGNVNENNNYRSELAGAFLTGPVKHELTVGITQNNREAEVTTNPVTTFNNRSLFDPQPLPFTPLPARVVATASEIEDQGVYLFDRLSYREWLQILAGVRYTDYQSTSQRFVAPLTRTVYSDEVTSPAFGLVVKPRSSISLYGTYIEGLEEGGIAPVTAVNSGEILPAGISEQFELGVKVELDELLVSVAYFDIDRPSSFTDLVTNRFVQEGRSTYQGFEFSATGEITERLSIYATAMDLDAEQVRTANPAQQGLRPENTPEFTGSLFLEYRPAAVPGLSVSAGAFYVGDRAVNVLNQAFVGGYTTFDVGARFQTELFGNDTMFRFYMENVGDKRYWAATATNLLNPNLPPTAKLSMTVRF